MDHTKLNLFSQGLFSIILNLMPSVAGVCVNSLWDFKCRQLKRNQHHPKYEQNGFSVCVHLCQHSQPQLLPSKQGKFMHIRRDESSTIIFLYIQNTTEFIDKSPSVDDILCCRCHCRCLRLQQNILVWLLKGCDYILFAFTAVSHV